MNSYDFFIYEFICFINLYMNSGVPRFQMPFSYKGEPARGLCQEMPARGP